MRYAVWDVVISIVVCERKYCNDKGAASNGKPLVKKKRPLMAVFA